MNASFPMSALRGQFDQAFSNLIDGAIGLTPLVNIGRRSFPAINMWENETSLFAEVELPGLTMDDIEVLVMGNELTIRGERREVEQPNSSWHRQERGVGGFSRAVRLPLEVDADDVSASLRDGVLTITLPKAKAALPRKIVVKS
jgi:HSP20 family protein